MNEATEIANHIREGFISLYTTNMKIVVRRHWSINNWPIQLLDQEANGVSKVADQEVKGALWTKKPYKALDPDGLPAGFFQLFWLVVGESVNRVVKGVFNKIKVPKHMNKTLITLIPKHSGADHLGNFSDHSVYSILFTILSQR